MRVIQLNPVAPAHYSEAEKSAWLRGYRDEQFAGEGPESMNVITPFDVDQEAELYEAWEAGREAFGAPS